MCGILCTVFCVFLAFSGDRTSVYAVADVFSDNIVIGHALIDYTDISVEQEPYIYLLHEAGYFGDYSLSDGYLMGFQWATDISDVNTLVNFQVYRSTEMVGTFELVTETGPISSASTQNEYYFPEGVLMRYGSYNSYYLAVVQYGDVLPVHTQGCSTNNQVLGSTDSPPSVGSTVNFGTVYSNCLVIAFQAVYLPTSFALDGCTLQVIEEDTEEVWSYSLVTLSQRTNCWILRAAREDLSIELNTQEFNVPCDHGLTLTTYTAGFAESETQSVCGSMNDVFESWQSNTPYVHGYVSFSAFVTSASFIYRVKNIDVAETQEAGGTPSWGFVVIGLGMFSVVFVCTLMVSIKNEEKEKKRKQEDEARQKAEREQKVKEEREKTEKEQKEKKEKEEREKKEKEEKEKKVIEQKEKKEEKEREEKEAQKQEAKAKHSVASDGASASREEGVGSSQVTVSKGSALARQGWSWLNSQRKCGQANPVTVFTVDPAGNRILPLEAPPSYNSVMMERGQGVNHGAILADTATDIYGIPLPAKYQEL